MVEADEQPAARILDPLELAPRIAVEVAAIGNSGLDRRELDEVVLAFLRSIQHEQHKPNWLQRNPPSTTTLVRRTVEAPVQQFVIIPPD